MSTYHVVELYVPGREPTLTTSDGTTYANPDNTWEHVKDITNTGHVPMKGERVTLKPPRLEPKEFYVDSVEHTIEWDQFNLHHIVQVYLKPRVGGF